MDRIEQKLQQSVISSIDTIPNCPNVTKSTYYSLYQHVTSKTDFTSIEKSHASGTATILYEKSE